MSNPWDELPDASKTTVAKTTQLSPVIVAKPEYKTIEPKQPWDDLPDATMEPVTTRSVPVPSGKNEPPYIPTGITPPTKQPWDNLPDASIQVAPQYQPSGYKDQSYFDIASRASAGTLAAGADAGANVIQGLWDTLHVAGQKELDQVDFYTKPISQAIGLVRGKESVPLTTFQRQGLDAVDKVMTEKLGNVKEWSQDVLRMVHSEINDNYGKAADVIQLVPEMLTAATVNIAAMETMSGMMPVAAKIVPQLVKGAAIGFVITPGDIKAKREGALTMGMFSATGPLADKIIPGKSLAQLSAVIANNLVSFPQYSAIIENAKVEAKAEGTPDKWLLKAALPLAETGAWTFMGLSAKGKYGGHSRAMWEMAGKEIDNAVKESFAIEPKISLSLGTQTPDERAAAAITRVEGEPFQEPTAAQVDLAASKPKEVILPPEPISTPPTPTNETMPSGTGLRPTGKQEVGAGSSLPSETLPPSTPTTEQNAIGAVLRDTGKPGVGTGALTSTSKPQTIEERRAALTGQNITGLQFIKDNGGIKAHTGRDLSEELFGNKGKGGAVDISLRAKKGEGKSADEMASLMQEAGFLPGGTERDLLDWLNNPQNKMTKAQLDLEAQQRIQYEEGQAAQAEEWTKTQNKLRKSGKGEEANPHIMDVDGTFTINGERHKIKAEGQNGLRIQDGAEFDITYTRPQDQSARIFIDKGSYKPPKEPVAKPANGELLPANEIPFNLVSDKAVSDAELARRDAAEAKRVEAEKKRKLEEQTQELPGVTAPTEKDFNAAMDAVKKTVNPDTGKPYTEGEIRTMLETDDVVKVARFKDMTPEEQQASVKHLVGLGAAKADELLPNASATSLRNKQTDRERVSLGYKPAEPVMRRTFNDDVLRDARQEYDSNPNAGQDLVKKLVDDPAMPLTDTQDAILLMEQIEAQTARNRAAQETLRAEKTGDQEQIDAAQVKLADANDRLFEIYEVGRKAGTANARALNARKMFMNEDYELVSMEMHFRAINDGKPLTKEQTDEVKRIHGEYQKTIDALNKKIADLEAKQKTENDAADKTDADTVMKDIEKKAAAKSKTESVAGKKPDLDADIKNILDDIANAAESDTPPKISDLHDEIQKLALFYEQKNIDANAGKSTLTHEELIKSVHADIKSVLPDATPEQVRDAISGYGVTRFPSKDAARTALRKHKSELLKVAPLETVIKNIDALRAKGKDAETELATTKHTGYQRDQIEARARDLGKQLSMAMKEQDRLMKEIGIKSGDPARRLKSALDAKKTRLTNQISDLNRAIESRKELLKDKGVPINDAETKRLESERDLRLETYKEMFPDKPLTDQERLDRAIRNAENSLDDWNARVEDARKGIFRTNEKGVSLPDSERLSLLQREKNAVIAEVAWWHNLAFPRKTPEEIALQSFKTRTQKNIDRLQNKIDTLDFSPRPEKKPLVLDAEGFKLQEANDAVKAEWKTLLEKHRLENRTWTQKVWDYSTSPLNAARQLLSSMDLSATMRQGDFLGTSHPFRSATSFVPQLKAWRSKYEAYKTDAEIRSRPNAKLYSKFKLELTSVGGKVTDMEEVYMLRAGIISKAISKIPGVEDSQRAYVTYLNKLRADAFDAMVKTASRTGSLTDIEYKALANYINVATGRGALGVGQIGRASEFLATVFWSPRLMASRFQLLAGQPLYHGSWRTRKLIAQDYGRYLIGKGIFYALAMAAGVDIEWDPRSSDFGKLKFGNTRVDPLAGLSQTTVFLTRIATGQKKTLSGNIEDIRGENVPYGGDDTTDVIKNFLRAKLSPLLSTAIDIPQGETVVGEPVTVGSTIIRNTIPLSFNDIFDVMKDQGVPAGTALTLLSILGMGVQTYQNAQDSFKEQEDALRARIAILNAKRK